MIIHETILFIVINHANMSYWTKNIDLMQVVKTISTHISKLELGGKMWNFN